MANIKISALSELTAPADGDMLPMNDVSEAVGEKTKRILFSTLRKAAMADADGDTKITVDNSADEDIIRFFAGAGGEQAILYDGALEPTTDNDLNLGSSTRQFKLACIKKHFITGSFYASLPTNGIGADAKFMLGDANTISWFYNNVAPPGWKIFATGDYVLRVGTTGGITGGTWTISGLSFSTNSYNASWAGTYESPGHAGLEGDQAPLEHNHIIAGGVTSDGAWRPQGVIGKLCQLDAA
jgi:hypothetical protein